MFTTILSAKRFVHFIQIDNISNNLLCAQSEKNID